MPIASFQNQVVAAETAEAYIENRIEQLSKFKVLLKDLSHLTAGIWEVGGLRDVYAALKVKANVKPDDPKNLMQFASMLTQAHEVSILGKPAKVGLYWEINLKIGRQLNLEANVSLLPTGFLVTINADFLNS